MTVKLSISPSGLIIDGGRVTSDKAQIRKNAGLDRFIFMTEPTMKVMETIGALPWATLQYVVGDYCAILANSYFNNGSSPGYVYPSQSYFTTPESVGVWSEPVDHSKRVIVENGNLQTFDAERRKTLDTGDLALYLSDYFEGSEVLPAQSAAVNTSTLDKNFYNIGECHAGASFVVGSFKINNQYWVTHWMQASNSLVVDNQMADVDKPWNLRVIAPIIDGTDVKIQEDVYIASQLGFPSVMVETTVQYKIWVGGFN